MMIALLLTLFLAHLFCYNALETCATAKVAVTPSALDAPIVELQWIGRDDSLLFAVTESGTLYRSKDGGATWDSQMPFLEGIDASLGVSSVYQTADAQAFYVLGHNKRLWVTESKGNNYRAVDFEQVIHSVSPYVGGGAAEAKWVMIDTRSDRCFDRAADGVCKTLVYVSKDLLATAAELLTTDVVQFVWGDAGRMYVSTWQDEQEDEHTFRRRGYDVALMYTDQPAPPYTLQVLKEHCAGFLITDEALWSAVYPSDGTSGLELHYGADHGRDALERLQFPSELDEGRYTIVSGDNSTLFVNVQHGELNWGNLYTAGHARYEPHVFSLSLERAARYPDGAIEMMRFSGVRAAFIANIIDDDNNERDNDERERRFTVMTHDNGGEWLPLQPPASTATSGARTCTGPHCHLHLHGLRKRRLHRDRYLRQEFGPLHTKSNTVGMALATGNVGETLSDDVVSVFMTRDGGWQWQEIEAGSFTYDFADHGALTLLAANDQTNNTVLWSRDEGLTWTECDAIGDAKNAQGESISLWVDDVVADPAGAAERVLVHGLDVNSGAGYVLLFDFANLYDRSCAEDDYELWSPQSAIADPCVLGERDSFRRRRRDADCYNFEVIEPRTFKSVCKCGRTDYTCDVCYEPRTSPTGVETCELTENCDAAPIIPPVEPCDNYTVSRGYVLVADTICELDGGLDLLGSVHLCPNRLGGGGAGGKVLLVLLLLTAFCVVGGLLFVWRRRSAAPPSLQYGTLESDGGAFGEPPSSDSSSSSESDGAAVLSNDEIETFDPRSSN